MPYIGYRLVSPDDLEHFGIKGMRWGVRRFQNEDGTRTALGKKRYNDSDDDDSSMHEDARSARSKKPSEMSDAELKKAMTRMQQEAQYNEWKAKADGSNATKKGESVAKKYFNQAAGIAVGILVTKAVNDTISGGDWSLVKAAQTAVDVGKFAVKNGLKSTWLL